MHLSVDVKCSNWSAKDSSSQKMVKNVLKYLSEDSILERTANCETYFEAIETVAEKQGKALRIITRDFYSYGQFPLIAKNIQSLIILRTTRKLRKALFSQIF